MSKLMGLVELVQTAIDKGATSVEDVHKYIANEPFEILNKIGPIGTVSKGIQNIQNQTIGSVYDLIRTINKEIGDIAKDLLEKAEKLER